MAAKRQRQGLSKHRRRPPHHWRRVTAFTIGIGSALVFGATPARADAAGTTPVESASDPTPPSPSPSDVARTPYGDVGKWLLGPHGQISDWGSQPYQGRRLLEPVNVIILDPRSRSVAQSTERINAAMRRAGFPAQPLHTTGFSAVVGGDVLGQQPAGGARAFSNAFFLLPNDHARAFGPASTPGGGYLWSAAVSREQLGIYNQQLAHNYVSFDTARDVLASRFAASGATSIGRVPLDNAYQSATETTGDNDGYAAVLRIDQPTISSRPRNRSIHQSPGALPAHQFEVASGVVTRTVVVRRPAD